MFRKLILSNRLQILIIILLFLLLPVLALFQYHWLGQLSDAEKVRMQNNLQVSTERFAEEFDNELTKIYTNFNETNLNSKEYNPKLLHETLLNWKNNTDLPKLISDIFAINIAPNKEIHFYKFDTTKVELNKVEFPKNLLFLRKYFNHNIENIFFRLISLTHGPVLKPVPLILVTQPSEILIESVEENCTDNWLIVIMLNEKLIMNQFLPDLIKKHYYQNDKLEYRLIIYKQGKNESVFYKSNEDLKIPDFSEPDAIAKLGSWRTRNMIVAQAQYVTNKSEVNIRKKVENEKSLSIKVFTDDSNKNIESSKYLIAKMERWKLAVKHIDGSLESIVKRARLKNLLISYTILLILGIGVIFALVYARKVQKVGQQQMEFVAGVTHELRTPLAVIQSAGENIADGVVTGKEHYKKYGHLIRDEGKRLGNMVEQVLEFAGIESKNQHLSFEKIDIENLLNTIVEKYKQSAKINLIKNCQITTTKGDKNALITVFNNILDNALKFCETKPEIEITIDSILDELEITIQDNGFGINKEELENIFKPFYRGKNVIEKTIAGSGLGLSLVQSIIKNHNGEIIVQSEENSGTTFIIKFPIAKTV